MQLKELEGHQVDIAIMGGPPKEPATRAEPFAAHPHVFVAPTDHPLLKVGHPTVDNLRPYGFILRVVMEMSNNETIKQAVMAGMGISFL